MGAAEIVLLHGLANREPESWVVEFHHPHFGWLDYDQRHA